MCLQYKSVENTVGKEEIARYEQFALFTQFLLPRRFFFFLPFSSNLSSANSFSWKSLKFVVWERVKPIAQTVSIFESVFIEPFSQTTNFRFFQNERVCRRQFEI